MKGKLHSRLVDREKFIFSVSRFISLHELEVLLTIFSDFR